MKQRFAALLDMAPKHPGRAALAVLCAVTLLGGSVVACRPAEAEPPKTLNAPAIPAGDFLDDRSGLYFSSYVGAGVVLPAELRDRVEPRHREKSSGEPQVEFLDREDPEEEQLFTLEHWGCAYPTDSSWGKAIGESWFQAGQVAGLTTANGELAYDDPVSGYRLTLPGRDMGGLLVVSWQEEDVFRLLCLHPEMVEQAGMPDLLLAGAGVFSLTLVEGEPEWSFGWEAAFPDLALSPEAEEPCRTVAEAWADITAGLERSADASLFVRDLLYEDGRLTFTPLEEREDGTWVQAPDQRRTLPVAEDVAYVSPSETLEGFFQWAMLSSAWIDALEMTVENGEIVSMAWANLGTDTHVTVTSRRQAYALSASYDPSDEVLTYTPIWVDETDMSYLESDLGVQAVQVSETVSLKGGLGPVDGVEDFLYFTPALSSWWPRGLKLTIENGFLTELKWVNLSPPEDIPVPETRLGVLSGRVDVEAGTVSGLWLDEAGQIDRDSPFTLPVEEGANIQVLDSRGFYTGPITLEDLEQLLLPLSSLGPTFELSILDGAVVGIVTHQGIITNQALREGKPGMEGWTFHQLRSQNPGDGTYTARWESLEGVYNRMKLEVGAETQATVTYTVTEPGEGFVVAMVFEDGAVQRLGEGENTVTLPVGRTTLALGGVDGTAGGFKLEVSPADRIGING